MDEEKELPPIEYGVSSLKSGIPIGDEDLNPIFFVEGDAHGGRVRMYDLATSTGDPVSPSAPCNNRNLLS